MPFDRGRRWQPLIMEENVDSGESSTKLRIFDSARRVNVNGRFFFKITSEASPLS